MLLSRLVHSKAFSAFNCSVMPCACFMPSMSLWELLFLRLTHKFSVPLFRRLGTDFSDSLIKIHRYICYASVSAASVLHKGLGLSQQAKTDTARQEPDLAVFRECGYTPYACYDSVSPFLCPALKAFSRNKTPTRNKCL